MVNSGTSKDASFLSGRSDFTNNVRDIEYEFRALRSGDWKHKKDWSKLPESLKSNKETSRWEMTVPREVSPGRIENRRVIILDDTTLKTRGWPGIHDNMDPRYRHGLG